MMTVEPDWLTFLFEPARLLCVLDQLSDGQRVFLMKQFLSQAELHDRRTTVSSSVTHLPGRTSPIMPSAEAPSYDKSKILDTLALEIAASFNFNVNLFSGVVTELPLRLSSRLYRTLFLSLLKSAATGDACDLNCTTPYDLGSWSSLEPSVAFAAYAYHLWCLQVAFSISLLPQPFRNMTPVVAGLPEVPDVAFMSDSRADLEAILVRREESATRLVSLFNFLQQSLTDVDDSCEKLVSLIVARPKPASFPVAGGSGGCKPLMDSLSSGRVLAATAFSLGRLAFQHCLMERALDFFNVAYQYLQQEGLTFIEEVGTTPGLIESYMKACQAYVQSPESSVQSTLLPSLTLHDYVTEFCDLLKCELNHVDGDTDFVARLLQFGGGSLESPTKPNLRTCLSKTATLSKDTDGIPQCHIGNLLSHETVLESLSNNLDLVTSSEIDQFSSSTPVPLSDHCRHRLEELTSLVLSRLAEIYLSKSRPGTTCKGKSRNKEMTQSRNLFSEWKAFYSRVVANNAIAGALRSSFATSSRFIDRLVAEATTDSNDSALIPSIDQNVAEMYFFEVLAKLLGNLSSRTLPSGDSEYTKSQRCALYQFLTELITSAVQSHQLAAHVKPNNGQHGRGGLVLDALIRSPVFDMLPVKLQSISKVAHKNVNLVENDQLALFSLPGALADDPNFLPLNETTSGPADTDLRHAPPPPSDNVLLFTMTTGSCSISQTVSACECLLAAGRSGAWILRANAAWMPSLLRLAIFSPLFAVGLGESVPVGSGPGRRGALPVRLAETVIASSIDPSGHNPSIPIVPASASRLPNSDGSFSELFVSIVHENPQCLVSLVLLARALVTRRFQLNFDLARSFNESAMNHLPSIKPGNHQRDRGVPAAPAVNWSRSFAKWIHSAVEHEFFLLDLLEAIPPSSEYSACKQLNGSATRAVDLIRQSKSLLLQAAGLSNELGRDPLITDELVAAASCLLLRFGEYSFLTPCSPPAVGQLALPPAVFPLPATGSYALGPLELLRSLMRLHYEAVAAIGGDVSEENYKRLSAAAHDLWYLVGQRCSLSTESSVILQMDPLWPSRVPPPPSVRRSKDSATGTISIPPSTIYQRPAETDSFVVWLLSTMGPETSCSWPAVGRIHPLHHLVDCLLMCLSALLCTVNVGRYDPLHTDFHLGPDLAACWWNSHAGRVSTPQSPEVHIEPGDSPLGRRDIWPSTLPASMKVSVGCLSNMLTSTLNLALSRAPWRVDWLLLKADLERILTGNSHSALSYYLQAGAAATSFFSRPVPTALYNERVVRSMVDCCQSLGLVGEAIVLCQLSPERFLLTHALHLIDGIDSARHKDTVGARLNGELDVVPRSSALSSSLDSIDSLTNFIWDVDILEALSNLEFDTNSVIRRSKFMETINQPELNTCNAAEVLHLARSKRASEFLRYMFRLHFF